MNCKPAFFALDVILIEHLSRSPSKAAPMSELIAIGCSSGMTREDVSERIHRHVMSGSVTCLPIGTDIMVQLVGGDV